MFLLIPRSFRPDAAYWPGRRLLAVLDAIVWPLACAAAVLYAPFETGIAGRVLCALASVVLPWRFYVAVWRNERYRFTTWRWGRLLVLLALVGIAMKVVA